MFLGRREFCPVLASLSLAPRAIEQATIHAFL
jgi:hypothetical protein